MRRVSFRRIGACTLRFVIAGRHVTPWESVVFATSHKLGMVVTRYHHVKWSGGGDAQ